MPPKHVEEAERIAKEHDEAMAQGAGTPPAETPPPADAVAAPPPDVPPPVEAPQPAPPEGEGDWQQKYQTLKGKFDSEVPRLSAELRDSRAQVNDLATRLNALEQQPPAATPPATPPAQITDEDIENFGPELSDFIKRQATVVAASMTAEVRAENAQLRQQIEQAAASTGQVQADRYFAKLAELVPDYEVVNVDPAFLAWLGEVDAMAGVPRQAFLNTAFEARDPVRTATVFKMYKEATGQVTPSPAPTPPSPPAAQPTPAAGGNGNGISISPNSGTGGQPIPVAADANQIWSGNDIKNFTNDILRGVYRGREADQATIQADIDRAIVEGRIRP